MCVSTSILIIFRCGVNLNSALRMYVFLPRLSRLYSEEEIKIPATE